MLFMKHADGESTRENGMIRRLSQPLREGRHWLQAPGDAFAPKFTPEWPR